MPKLLDPLKRRDILFGKKTPPEILKEYGTLYLKEGRPNDAVEFFGQAKYKEGLLLIQQMSLEEGDFFLFSRAMELLQEECSPNNWSELGKNALEKGKYLFALKAFEKINDREGIAEAQKNLGKIIKDEGAK